VQNYRDANPSQIWTEEEEQIVERLHEAHNLPRNVVEWAFCTQAGRKEAQFAKVLQDWQERFQKDANVQQLQTITQQPLGRCALEYVKNNRDMDYAMDELMPLFV